MNTIRKPFAGFLCLVLLLSLLTACASENVQGSSLPSEPSETSSDGLPSETQVYPEEFYDFSQRTVAEAGDWITYNQIPEDILEILTTKQLWETCLRCPMNHGFVYLSSVRYTPEEWMYHLPRSFNGLRELIKRENLSMVLWNYYSKLTAEDVTDKDGVVREADLYTAFLVKQGVVSKETCEKIYKKLGTLEEAYASVDPAWDPEILTGYSDLRGALEERMLMSDEELQDALKEQFLRDALESVKSK